MIDVAGSLWSVPAADRLATATALGDAGLSRLHWDMTDGEFAAAGGFTPASASSLAVRSGLAAEAHIMAHRSARDVDEWTDFCDLVIVHVESEDWRTAVTRIERRGCRPGLAISPQTPSAEVPNELTVLCMSIVPGQAGSRFDESVLTKIGTLREAAPTRRIGVDGGIRREHADLLAAAGADWVVVGTDLVTGTGADWHDLLRGDESRSGSGG